MNQVIGTIPQQEEQAKCLSLLQPLSFEHKVHSNRHFGGVDLCISMEDCVAFYCLWSFTPDMRGATKNKDLC